MASEKLQEDLLAKIDDLLTEKLQPITYRLNNIEETLGQISDPMEKVEDLEKQWKAQEKKYQQMEADLNVAKLQNKKLKEDIVQQEMYSRRKNVKIHGISHPNQENLEDVVIQKLNDVGVMIRPQDIDSVHYVGQPKLGNRRSVILRLLRWKDKQAIMKVKDRLRQTNIIIQEDYPKEVQERRRMLLPVFFKALELYPTLNPKFYTDRFNLAGKVYTIDNIHSIQYPELLPERVFSPVKNGIQAFFTKFSPLSNFYHTRIEAEGKIFQSSEHYFMYKKALHFEDKETAKAIIETQEPEKVKQLGKRIQGFLKSEWHKVSKEYMYQAMLLKFSQSENLKGFLLSTSGNRLIEASAEDKFWGVGLSLRSPHLFDEAKWVGKNCAGETLQRVRQALM